MSVPGAENPEKVKNIVRGEGVLEGFRELYSVALRDTLGLRWEGEKEKQKEKEIGWRWRGRGEEMLVVSYTSIRSRNIAYDAAAATRFGPLRLSARFTTPYPPEQSRAPFPGH